MPAGVDKQDTHQGEGQTHCVHTLKRKALAPPGDLPRGPANICRMVR